MTPNTTGGVRPITVVVADDHPVVRAGLMAMLSEQPGVEVVGEAGDGAECLSVAARRRPDVVLTDLRMPVMDGAAATAAIRRAAPEVQVIVLTTYDTDTDILRAVEAGARGYLLKDAPPEELVAAIRAAARGETVLAAPVARRLSAAGKRSEREVSLSPREVDVLQLVARGHSNAQIGTRLGIGEATVKTHLMRIFTKLDVPDRTSAVTAALQRGLIAL